MKKFFCITLLLLIIVSAVCLFGCSDKQSPDNESNDSKETESDTAPVTDNIFKIEDFGSYEIIGANENTYRNEKVLKSCESSAKSIIEAYISVQNGSANVILGENLGENLVGNLSESWNENWNESTKATSALMLYDCEENARGVLFELETDGAFSGCIKILLSEDDTTWFYSDEYSPLDSVKDINGSVYCFGTDDYYEKDTEDTFKSLITGETISHEDAEKMLEKFYSQTDKVHEGTHTDSSDTSDEETGK
ncbi:MAG: hypothetical protein ACI4QZ_05545 [Eubacteriales bacterium]